MEYLVSDSREWTIFSLMVGGRSNPRGGPPQGGRPPYGKVGDACKIPYRRSICNWLEFCLSHKRDHLKRNRLAAVQVRSSG